MNPFAILLGGELTVTARLTAQLAGTRVIAADSGIRHAELLGVTPELWVGDFDSATDEDQARHRAVAREAHPAAKPKTDGELAVAAALSRGADRLVLVGAFGGRRADHGFLHLAMALALARQGVKVLLTSGREEGMAVLPGEIRPDLPEGTLFSLLAFSDLAGLTITGARWTLADRAVAFGSSLTLSNIAGAGLTIRLAAGQAVLIAQVGG